MSQSKRNSLIESIVNTIIGLLITMLFSPLIYYVADVKISYNQMGITTILFTIISVIRNYIIRRWFNKNKNENNN